MDGWMVAQMGPVSDDAGPFARSLMFWNRMRPRALVQNQYTRELRKRMYLWWSLCTCYILACQWELPYEIVPLVQFMYLVFTRMPGELPLSLLLCLRDVFRAPINSLACWGQGLVGSSGSGCLPTTAISVWVAGFSSHRNRHYFRQHSYNLAHSFPPHLSPRPPTPSTVRISRPCSWRRHVLMDSWKDNTAIITQLAQSDFSLS